MILTTCAACAAPLARTAPRCVRCHTRYCDSNCQHDHWRRGQGLAVLLWSEDWADRERAAAFVSEARRFHDESAARLAAAINELRSNASLSEEGGSPTSQDAPTRVAPAADEVVEIEAARAPPTCCVVCCVC